ncbi:hypothetical protein FRC00_010371 [Tulasnella sp. 408]|nr:hypothetical protein FRC00_010371 [Tulasnella sp. 408]
MSDARSPSIPSGKVLVLREHWEGVARSEPPSSHTLPKLYGLHNATKTPIPVPLAGSRGPTVNGSRPQQKLSKSMGTREDSTNSTSNKSSNPTANKMQGKIPPKSGTPKIDSDSLLPIKAFFSCGQMIESVPNDSSRQYFLQWGANSLSFVDQANLEASGSSNGRQFGKAQLYLFMWGDIFDARIPAIEDEKAAISTGRRETRTAMTNAATGPKRTSERVKTAPLRLRDTANGPAVEDQPTDGDEGTSKAESDGLLSTTREHDSNLRRSRRQRAAPLAVNLNDNELLFSYPPVNITRGDFGRLEPDEFLNDTLIEFGLKLWQNDLKEKNPQLADDIWVFNSFFYKKLSNRKVEGYPSVKKWTAKVDIFRKKFIVVPINENLHWYLAIIYQPGASLHSVRPKTPPPPPMTRASLKHVVQTRPRRLSSVSSSPLPEMELGSAANTDIEDSMEVDQELLGGDDSAKTPILARGLMSPSESGASPHMDVDGSEESIVEEDGDVEMASRFPETSKPSPVKASNTEAPGAESSKDLLEYASSDDEPNHLQAHDPRPPDLTELAKKCSLGEDTSSDEISPNEDGKVIFDEVPKPAASEPRSTSQIEQCV